MIENLRPVETFDVFIQDTDERDRPSGHSDRTEPAAFREGVPVERDQRCGQTIREHVFYQTQARRMIYLLILAVLTIVLMSIRMFSLEMEIEELKKERNERVTSIE